MTCEVVDMVEMVATEEAVEVNTVEVDNAWKFSNSNKYSLKLFHRGGGGGYSGGGGGYGGGGYGGGRGKSTALDHMLESQDPWEQYGDWSLSKVAEAMVVVATRPSLQQDYLQKKHFRFKISIHAYLVLFCYAVLSNPKLYFFCICYPTT